MFNDSVEAMSIPLTSVDASDHAAAGAAIGRLFGDHPPRLVGLGEPAHQVDEFLRLRNGVFRHLVEHAGFRTLALESDAWAGRSIDAWVRGGPGAVEDVQ